MTTLTSICLIAVVKCN